MNTIIKTINQLNEGIGKATSWLTSVLVLLICYDVIMRYAANQTSAWITELEWHLFALIFLLGAGYALKHDRHVRVDLFYSRMKPIDQAWINFTGTLLFLLPWCSILLYYSYLYGVESFRLAETSPDPGGLPARYLIKFAIPTGMLLLWLQGLSLLLESMQVIFNHRKK